MLKRYAGPGNKGAGVSLYEDVLVKGVMRRKAVRKILWGDWLNVVEQSGEWGRLNWSGKTYWVKMSDTQEERPLEIIFIDVGQGDGCFIVAQQGEDEKRIVVDAGADSNMSRFLGWRFRLGKNTGVKMHAAVITHSDKDHYGGFQALFDSPHLTFENVYHNGIAERAGANIFGPIQNGWLTDLADTHERIDAIYADPANVVDPGKTRPKLYPKLMKTALARGKASTEVRMLSTATAEVEDGRAWMPGFSPGQGSRLTIEVLGPVVEPDGAGRPRLRVFGEMPDASEFSASHTKNGHSILLMLRYGQFSLLLGGDLNRSSEEFLLRHYGGVGPDQPLRDTVANARKRLGADMMKSCHHGSSDVTDEFLDAVHPFAFVVSSGEEGYAHPRPDLLGRLGRHGRGKGPLILCTEILRSTREREAADALRRLTRYDALIENPATSPEDRKKAREDRTALHKELTRRNVAVYGAITLRTDGDRMVVAFRHEDSAAKASWQTFWYENRGDEGFEPIWRDDKH